MLPDLSLYVIVDPQFTGGRDPIAVARAALLGGATMLQLRDKSASTRVLLATARELVALAHKRGAPLIVNDRVDVALAAGADGVHLGPDDLPVTAARGIMSPQALIGFSAGTPDEARDAEKSGADYLGTGAIYATSSKADAGPAIGVAGQVPLCCPPPLPRVGI